MFATDGRGRNTPGGGPASLAEPWPTSGAELDDYARRLDPDDPAAHRIGWKKNIKAWKNRPHVLMMRAAHRLFPDDGGGWLAAPARTDRAESHDDPGFVREMMRINGEFVAALTGTFSAGGADRCGHFQRTDRRENHGALISPKMYEELVLSSYLPILEVLTQPWRGYPHPADVCECPAC